MDHLGYPPLGDFAFQEVKNVKKELGELKLKIINLENEIEKLKNYKGETK